MVGAAPRRHEGDGGAALRISLFGIFVQAEEEEEEQEEALQVLFWCADTALWAKVLLSLFFFWCAVFPSVDDRPKMLDIMAGTEQKNSYVLLMCKVGFPGLPAPRAAFPSLSSGPSCSASWQVWTRRIFRHVQGLVCWYLTMSFALCSSWLSQAQDARHHGRHGPQDSYVEVHRCSSWTRSSTCPLVCYEWRHGPDSAENCLAIPQVQLIITVVDIFFVTQRQFSLVQIIQLTIEISLSFVFGGRCPSLQVLFSVVVLRQILWSRLFVGPFSSPVNTVADVPVVQVVLAIPVVVNDRCARFRLCRIPWRSRSYCSSSSSTFPCCVAEVDPHGLRDHGDSTICSSFPGGQCPC